MQRLEVGGAIRRQRVKEDLYPVGVKASEFMATIRRYVSNMIPAVNEIMMSSYKVYS
jgi:hypothetical protein